MIVLPNQVTEPEAINPRSLVLYSKPKVGKTTALSFLEDTLIIDIEEGSSFVKGLKYNVRKVARENNQTTLEALWLLLLEIKKTRPYKRIVLDTVTELEELVKPYAKTLYNNTPMGATYQGDVLHLPNGGGYLYLREAFFKTIELISECADEVIFVGHLKDTLINKDGKEVSAKELDLTGKIKSMLSADVDAIGLLYRGKDDECILSFKTTDDVICGARPKHLKNKEIVLTKIVDGKFINNWDQVYLTA